jgi:putative aldouronate transport system substrate-binding protein
MTSLSTDRRTILRGALGLAALAGSETVLAACHSTKPSGPGSTTKTSSASGEPVRLPAYMPYTGLVAELPANKQGVLEGFLSYPSKKVSAADGIPGSGGTVSAALANSQPSAPGLDRNNFWQELNKRLGVKLDLSLTPAGDYADKFATIVAGGDLPDFLQVTGSVPAPPVLLTSKCQDLTEFLSGEAVKEYPNLANIPEAMWRMAVRAGGIYGLPVPRAQMGSMLFRRDDIIAGKGLNSDPASFEEFLELCQGLTDARDSKWALANPTGTLSFLEQTLGIANAWSLRDGQLTSSHEDPRVKDAFDGMLKLIKAGVVHPDGFSSTSTQYKQWFNNGTCALDVDNWTAWRSFYTTNTAGASYKINGILPPNYDKDAKANSWQGSPILSFTVLKKASKDRIRELLRIANWVASPFGTTEYLFCKFGISGVDYTMEDGVPTLTDTGKSEIASLNIGYITDAPYVLFQPGRPDVTKDQHAFQEKFLAMSVADPTLPLYSQTATTAGASLDKAINDAQSAILQGRKPVSSWDDAVKKWKQGGGDKIRDEYQAAL